MTHDDVKLDQVFLEATKPPHTKHGTPRRVKVVARGEVHGLGPGPGRARGRVRAAPAPQAPDRPHQVDDGDAVVSIDERQAALEILGKVIDQIIPEHRASGTASEHATATAEALLAAVEDLREQVRKGRSHVAEYLRLRAHRAGEQGRDDVAGALMFEANVISMVRPGFTPQDALAALRHDEVDDLRKKQKAALLAYAEMWKLASRLVIHGEQAAWVHTGQPAEVWDALRDLGIDPRDDTAKRGE